MMGLLLSNGEQGMTAAIGMPYEVPRLLVNVFCLLSLLRHVLS
jgi:hypothetical protein